MTDLSTMRADTPVWIGSSEPHDPLPISEFAAIKSSQPLFSMQMGQVIFD